MILRLCVVIRTFNNSRTISQVVKDIVVTTPFPVLILDDSSESPVTNSLYSFEVRQAMEQERVRVTRFERTQGRGAVLKFAMDQLIKNGFTHMLTMDGDGQHTAAEIHKLVNEAKQHPWDMILGRRPSQEKMGYRIVDSQTSFRLYPLFPLQTMRPFSNKGNFETEILIRLSWRNVQIREVEIDAGRPESEARFLFVHRAVAQTRAFILNAVLATFLLIRGHQSKKDFALALGLGVFIGCTPLLGYHTVLVVVAAFALRLNLVLMWIGSQISLPFISPFLIWTALEIGRNWFGITAGVEESGHLLRWWAGSIVLGLVLGTLIGGLVWLMTSLIETLKNRESTTRQQSLQIGVNSLKFILRRLGLKTAYVFLYLITPYFYLFGAKARSGLNEYYRITSPAIPWGTRQGFILRHFFRFGQVLMDRVYQGYQKDSHFRINGQEVKTILALVEKGQGLVLLNGHLGCWDLAASVAGGDKLTDQIHVVEFRKNGLSFHKLKDKMNPDYIHIVNASASRDALFDLHQSLKQGFCLALTSDRPLGDRFELVSFMGRLAPFDTTAIRVTAATGVPLVTTFGFKGDDNRYDFVASPPKYFKYNGQEPREAQILNWVSEYAREVEGQLQRYPDQWFNFYPFWSALPTAPGGNLAAQGQNVLLEELLPPLKVVSESETSEPSEIIPQ